MRRTLGCVFGLLTTIGVAAAQSRWHDTTVTGCLKESNGAYSLVETHGYAIYALAGGEQELQPMVDHTVTITGKTTAAVTSSAGISDNTKNGSLPPLKVEWIQNLSNSCKKK